VLRTVAILSLALVSTTVPSTTVFAAQRWHIDVVDNGAGNDVGRYSSLAIDRSGNFQIAYTNGGGTTLHYAFRGKQDKRWYTMQVDDRAGCFVSLAVDKDGRAHIAYNSPYETGLHYARWDGKQWNKLIVDPEATDHYTSIQVDSEGHPSISYYREVYPDHRYALYMKYAYRDGKQWYIQTVDHRWQAGKWNSIALDSQDRPYIAYAIPAQGDLALAHWNGSGWEHGVVESRATNGNAYVGTYTSIALDSADEPHIAYLDATNLTAKYAWREGSVWHTEIIDHLSGQEVAAGNTDVADRFSLKLDSRGRPHLAYYDPGLAALKYATRDDKGWHAEVVDNEGNVGTYPSLCLDQKDRPYISYHDSTRGQLRVANIE
jgi:hypothetical protein